MNTWSRVTLGQVLPFKYGKSLPERHRTHTGEYRVVSSAGFVDTHAVPLTKGPTVVIGRKGSIGTVYFSPVPVFPIDTTFYVEGSDEIVLRFAYYMLQVLPLKGMNNDSAVPGLNRAQAERLDVLLPQPWEQRAIAALLGSLDDKIDSNTRVVEKAPQYIRACVDAALATGEFEIPVSTLARFVNGGAFTKGATGTGRMVLRIAELNSGPGPSTVYNELDVPQEKLARPGDLLMSWSGSLGMYRWARSEAIINQHIFKVIPNAFPDWLVFDRIDAVMPEFRGIAKDKATTMGHIQRGHLDSTTVALPSDTAIKGLDEELGPLWQKLLRAERESLQLVALRDTLLPELLSGGIRVSEAAEMLQGVSQ